MDAPVIVVGGGPVGLSLAVGLARFGTSSIVIEKEATPSPQSRALGVWPRTLEILDDWGVGDEIRAAGIFLPRLEVSRASDGSPLLALDFESISDLLAHPGGLVIPQYETERVLMRKAKAGGLCQVLTDCEATVITQDDDGVDVRVRDANGERTLRGQFAVGCDGAHGFVRGALGLTLEGLTYGFRAVLSDDVVGDDDPQGPMVRLALDYPGFLFGIRFLPKTWRLIAFVPPDMDDATAMAPAVHSGRLAAVLGRSVQSQTLWKSVFKLHRRRAQRFVAGRIALAGDAAHLVSPAGGEGMNAGIQDAGNLAWKLAYAIGNRGDWKALLASYEAERLQMIADTVEKVSDGLTKMTMDSKPWVRRMVVAGAARALRGRGIQRKAARAFGMLQGRYTKSPLIDAKHPLAGRRIDDLRLSDGKRLNEERAGQAALVAVGGATVEGMRAIAVRVAPKRWCVKPPAILIVRPDGVVAQVIEKPTQAKVEAAWQVAFAGESFPGRTA